MIHGIGYPKFYIYDSAGVTLQTIPANLGTSGCISLTKRVTLNEKQPDRYDIQNESPYTRTELREFLGYKYKCSITVTQDDYLKGLLQYQADQSSTLATDIYKLKAIEAYANAGYKIKFTPHNDLEDLWGSQFPIWVDVKISRTNKVQRIYSDVFTMDINGTELLNSPYAFTAFDFATLSGVSNSNQCLSLDGSTQYGSCTEFDCGTTHTMEFWSKGITYATSAVIVSGTTGGDSTIWIDGTLFYYKAQGSGTISVTHGATLANRNHWMILRTGTAVNFYVNNVKVGTTQTLSANNSFKVKEAFRAATVYGGGKYGLLRNYTIEISETQRALQYNGGYGNWPLDIAANFIWEFNGTGGTGTSSETDQSGNSRTLTLVNTPTRTTW